MRHRPRRPGLLRPIETDSDRARRWPLGHAFRSPAGLLGAEDGAASVLGVGVVGLLVGALCAMAPLGGVLAVHQQVQGAADSAALAAADIASGRVVSGVPCEVAAAVAREAGARLDQCTLDDAIADVRLSAEVLGFTVHAAARAGPTQRTMAST